MDLSVLRSSAAYHGRLKEERPLLEIEGESTWLLDDTNRRLLAELQDDPRITMSALARQVGMCAPAVTERVQRLEREASSPAIGSTSTRRRSACR